MGETEEMGEKASLGLGAGKGLDLGHLPSPLPFFNLILRSQLSSTLLCLQ